MITLRPAPRAVLFDRDGTLVVDVPYNGDPALVVPMPTARETVRALRERGIPVGVISNQSGIARGLLTRAQVEAVNAEVDRILGPFDLWRVCPHGPADGCTCRKPLPGMILDAASELGLDPCDIAMIGDIGADVGAARSAGALSVLVPTPVTLDDEIRDAPLVAANLAEAVALLFAPGPSPSASTADSASTGTANSAGTGTAKSASTGTANSASADAATGALHTPLVPTESARS